MSISTHTVIVSNAGTEAVNGTYYPSTESGLTNGKTLWYKNLSPEEQFQAPGGDENDIVLAFILYFTGTSWRIRNTTREGDSPFLEANQVDSYYRANDSDDIDNPWEITDWEDTAEGQSPAPTFTDGGPVAPFSLNPAALTNPSDLFQADYDYDPNNHRTISLSLDWQNSIIGDWLPDHGITDADLDANSGDNRAVYFAILEKLWRLYEMSSYTLADSKRFKMTKAVAVDATNNIRYNTYTVHVQEEGYATQPETFYTSGIRAE